MKFYVKDTKKVVEIGVYDPKSGIGYTRDFIGNYDGFRVDKNGDPYFSTKEDAEWWSNACKKQQRINDFMFDYDGDDYDEFFAKLVEVCTGENDLGMCLDKQIAIIDAMEG